MTTVLNAVTAVLFPAGAAFCLLGALGLLRFPDTTSRLHAAAKAQTLGLLLVLVGAAAQMPGRHAAVLLLVALFQLFTAPISSQIIGRTAYRTHGLDRDLLLRDELADRLVRDGISLPGHDRPQRDDDAER
ncbi:monovalent cation/H(+) antiporter subunit G [Actinospica acidiphila]|uniref:Sodium:proton antiporter n=1 Tax=Streptomyces tunisiensis TaxID=948699 RepID=A0ABP7Y1X7_9ACTN|nr:MULTISPECIES: monovalent cation/H(+) antiporter subunit G [unclassified Streptomyces]AXI89541.1 Na+/H+ antiporter subunit G [Streptomyces sp. ETH9427]NEA80860.1 monovalent cation/H(+) antiporter subunit G [Actinospica acidiphila]WPW22279.1 monovalent cation/H(+) antiporter subunit G [Streptomyces griseoincarnatus]MBQ0970044.1 monovalent cation/H(+) antiporter subunit G [Streptomyces sp. RK31]MBU5946078.1 monovalent cation/H(+) antiporter subunit G [Streptomyces sp. PAM3C]